MKVDEVHEYTIQRVDFDVMSATYERHGAESWYRRDGENTIAVPNFKELELAYQEWLARPPKLRFIGAKKQEPKRKSVTFQIDYTGEDVLVTIVKEPLTIKSLEIQV